MSFEGATSILIDVSSSVRALRMTSRMGLQPIVTHTMEGGRSLNISASLPNESLAL